MTTHSLSKIITRVTAIQSQISLEKVQQASRSSSTFTELQESVLLQITNLVEGIEQSLFCRNLTAADLAIRSRRGYQWLKFLSNPDSFFTHLDALQRMILLLASERRKAGLHCAVALYHQGSLYKVRQRGNQTEMIAQESFLAAPDSILFALLEVAQDPTSRDARAILRDYTYSGKYQRVRERLEYLGVPPGSFSAGRVHNLDQSFQRINQQYFQGKLAQPHLIWNKRLTHRKFGHYQWDTDTVMVSSSLDRERVPAMVVDFVVYHELLHKKLGARRAKQNRIAHSREFRDAENQFAQVEKARQLLNRIARRGVKF
jgi:predicted SprT family Zn-dependent metalloprotease